MDFHPLDRTSLVTCGKNHVNFWTLDVVGGTLSKKTGVFDNKEKPKYVTCLAFSDSGDVLTGDSNGSILMWSKGTYSSENETAVKNSLLPRG